MRGNGKFRIAGSYAKPLGEEGHRSEPTGDGFRNGHFASIPALLDLRGRKIVGWEDSEPIREPFGQAVEHSESFIGAVESNDIVVDEMRDETIGLGQEDAVAVVHEVYAELHGGRSRVGG